MKRISCTLIAWAISTPVYANLFLTLDGLPAPEAITLYPGQVLALGLATQGPAPQDLQGLIVAEGLESLITPLTDAGVSIQTALAGSTAMAMAMQGGFDPTQVLSFQTAQTGPITLGSLCASSASLIQTLTLSLCDPTCARVWDQVTICYVPEPATIAFLGLGVMTVLRAGSGPLRPIHRKSRSK